MAERDGERGADGECRHESKDVMAHGEELLA
jgi:hypothetical protein